MSETTPEAPAEESQVDGATPDTDDGPKDWKAEAEKPRPTPASGRSARRPTRSPPTASSSSSGSG
jgi:hypothetical protein